MSLHVIVGAGPVGSTTAELLAAAGHEVRVVTRSGSGPSHPLVERVAADVSDSEALAKLCIGADALYNCANPAYHQWATDWPPMARALLAAATASGAVLVTMSTLYGYGRVQGAMTEDLPLAATGKKGRIRAGMWDEALAAHRAGRVRVTEARASDFFGPLVTDGGHLGERAVPRLLAGKTVRTIGDPGLPHSWTYIPDVARALVVLGTNERAWGRPWHVPTNPALSARAMVERMASLAGAPPAKVAAIPGFVLRAAGLVSPRLRELDEVMYQFDRPFVLDSSAFTETFGIEATPLEEALTETLAWWRARLAPAGSLGAAAA